MTNIQQVKQKLDDHCENNGKDFIRLRKAIEKNADKIEDLAKEIQDLKENYLVFKTSTALKLSLGIGFLSAVITTIINWLITKV